VNVDPASRCEHGSLEMGCLYCQIKSGQTSLGDVWLGTTKTNYSAAIDGVTANRIADLERTRAVDAARIAVLETEGHVNRRTLIGLESRIAVLEAEIIEMRTRR
jgi:hypothetical protein